MSNFEINFANKFSPPHAFSFWKARVALYAMLKAMGIGQGDEVILPGYTCVMDAIMEIANNHDMPGNEDNTNR
jgi:dTDP-4-amino-4,6-dideoxygalactose transaminase